MILRYITLFLIVATIGTIVFFVSKPKPNQKIKVDVNGTTITAELAQTPIERTKGLMFRENLKHNSGMLFVFPNEARHSFWMVNTLIPLDIIWLNANKEVIHIEQSVNPCTESVVDACKVYKPNEKAKYVLELNAGRSKELNIKLGTEINFEL